ncbi:MAG TPA: shikimate dehydrogenase [Intrasporangium sp.]|uniref:shikimate dehydrogenase n=1 Tax=Intrasporangium sp. TaxID=1925024 RepID=UPI002D7883AC|nr:shikimate dehydrogenase [Intrasporangium sp.]HET7399507.1 shikimate dehydrogenase [Intrasporangium sp.]
MLSRMRCEVWGRPIGHSLSPVLHRAAYAALGLTGWSYERREVDESTFPAELARLGPQWRGLSLTMPLKEVAAAAAVRLGDAARETGAVNTLVREPEGWVGHNTDVHGLRAALREAGVGRVDKALVLGSGATARSAVSALVGAGCRTITFMVRDRARPETVAQARAAGVRVAVVGMGEWVPVDVLVSTVPPQAVGGLGDLPVVGARAERPVLLDAVYGEGRTPLEDEALARGWRLAEGTGMLLHQAGAQVRLMTGRPAPIEAMRAALAAARTTSA